MSKKGGGSANREAQRARADEQARQERIRKGTASIGSLFDSQFNDQFFDKRRDAYINYAVPQLDDQFGDAKKQLIFALARSGLLDSSSRGSQTAKLDKRYSLGREEIASKGLAEATGARNSVEDARSNLIAMLKATGDDQGAAQASNARAPALSKPAAYSPLSQIFTDASSALSQQIALERAYALSGGATAAPRYSTGLFSSNPGAVVVRG